MADERARTRPVEEWRGIDDFLEVVRLRPSMVLPGRSLRALSGLLGGYSLALQIHGIDEPFDLDETGPFNDWLAWTRPWSALTVGWTRAIEENAGDREPLDLFFELLDEYRAITARGGFKANRWAPS